MKKPVNYVDHIAVRDENAVFGVEREAGTIIYDKANEKAYTLLKPANKWECLASFSDKRGFFIRVPAEMQIEIKAGETEFGIESNQPFTVDDVEYAAGEHVISGTAETEIAIVIKHTNASTIVKLNYNELSTVDTVTISNLGNMTILDQICGFMPSLTSLTISADTSGITSMIQGFFGCTGLTTFPLIDVSAVTEFYATWQGCTGMITFPELDYSAALSLESTFTECSVLTSISLTNVDNVVNMLNTFRDCALLTDITMDTIPPLTSATAIFRGCSVLTSAPALDFSACDTLYSIYRDCVLLTCIDGTIDATATGGDTGSMFDATTVLAIPDAGEQATILAGGTWTNSGTCP
ncbi:MAG: hypothetical protein ACTSQF_00140 [Candidatus Heimdallarchaeaceae archaeon]